MIQNRNAKRTLAILVLAISALAVFLLSTQNSPDNPLGETAESSTPKITDTPGLKGVGDEVCGIWKSVLLDIDNNLYLDVDTTKEHLEIVVHRFSEEEAAVSLGATFGVKVFVVSAQGRDAMWESSPGLIYVDEKVMRLGDIGSHFVWKIVKLDNQTMCISGGGIEAELCKSCCVPMAEERFQLFS